MSNQKRPAFDTLALILADNNKYGYFIYRNNQDRIEKQKQEEISRIQGKYDTANSQVDLLILTEEEQANINTQLESVKKALEEKNITEETNNTIESINNTIGEIKTNNNTLLTNKENELNGINIDRFNEEQRNRVTELQNQYHELKEQSNYKQAQAKIQEVIDYVNNTNGEITKAEEEERARQEEEERKRQEEERKRQTSNNKTSTANNYTPTQQPTAPVQQQTTTTQVEQKRVDITVNPNYTVQDNGDSYRIKVSGTVTNNNDLSFWSVRVIVTVYSSNGIKLDYCYPFYSELNANETAILNGDILINKNDVPDSNFTYKVQTQYSSIK